MSEGETIAIDPEAYRQVLGQYPTGVCVITAIGEDGEPIAMVVGSFTSVSLSPPLIGFFPDKASSSWAKLRSSRHFCVNMLAATQEHVCRKLASKSPDKFSGTAHSLSAKGIPLLHDVVARIECDMQSITDAGDHELALGLVRRWKSCRTRFPFSSIRGGMGAFRKHCLMTGK